MIDGAPYWDGGYAGNPPLWPLFYETALPRRDHRPDQSDRARRDAAHAGGDRQPADEITFNASLARGIARRRLRRPPHPLGRAQKRRIPARSGCIASAARAGSSSFSAATKYDVSWPFLERLRDLGRADTKAWLEENFDKIGVESTLDMDQALEREPAKPPTKGAAAAR